MRFRAASFCVSAAALVAVGFALDALPAARVGTAVDAAYKAFLNPSLLDPKPPPAPEPPAPPPPAPEPTRANVIADAEVDRALEGATRDDLEDPDGEAIAALTLPDMRVPITRRTLRYVRYFARTEAGRKVFLGCYRRSIRYRDSIEDALRAAELPLDLAWLPAIESGFDPRAVSPAGAAGLWQLMPETARAHGLSRTTWVDQRLDAARSTRAAVAHLALLHGRFKRWDLALAAYNAGSGRVQSAIDRLARDSASPRATFADLGAAGLLPDETAAYVPQVMAFAIVAINAETFHLDIPDSTSPAEPGFLSVPEGTRIDTIAAAAGVTVEVVRDLNPSLLGDRVPPSGGAIRVAIPGDRLAEAHKSLPARLDNEVVASEETDESEAEAADAGAPSAERDDPPSVPKEPLATSEPAFSVAQPAVRPLVPPTPDLVLRGPPLPAPPDPALIRVRLSPVSVGSQLHWPREPADPAPERAPRIDEAPSNKPSGDKANPRADKPPSHEKPAPVTPDKAEPSEPQDLMRVTELPNGILVRSRRDASAPGVSITTRLASLGEDTGPRGANEVLSTIRVGPRDLVAGLELAAARIRFAQGDLGSIDVVELRRRAGAARRRALDKAPYGRAWITLGETLFPPRHPLAGTVLGASADAASLRDLLLAEMIQAERGRARLSLTVVGDVDEGYVERIATALLTSIPATPSAPAAPVADRLFLEAPVAEARVLYGWTVESPSPADEASIRAAIELLSNDRIGRLQRALVVESGLAAAAHASFEVCAARTSVVAIEITIAPGHNVNEVERALDIEVARLATLDEGASDLATAAAFARDKVEEELAAASAVKGPADSASLALVASLRRALSPDQGLEVKKRLDVVTPSVLAVAVRRYLSPSSRAIVITTPKSTPDHRVAAR